MDRNERSSPCVTMRWEEAPRRILALGRELKLSRPFVVAISGPVGSGKSTLARAISTCIVSTDDYLPNYDTLPINERDDPEHADLALLAKHLGLLRDGSAVNAPVWSFHTHRRESWKVVPPASVVVCEGIHALHELPAAAADLCVFVEAPASIRWSRWEELERSGVRSWGVEVARQYFDGVAEPTFARYAAAYRRRAHAIVHNDLQQGRG